MSEKKTLPIRSKDGKTLAGSVSLGGKQAPKAKKEAKASSVGTTPRKKVSIASSSVVEKKKQWIPIQNSNRPKLGTPEQIIFQAHGLSEEEALALHKRLKAINPEWGNAQGRAFELLGDASINKLEELWNKEWPDFSKYRNDDAWDFAWNVAANTVIALSLRGRLTQKDYDTLTIPWRMAVGRIHPGDLEVVKVLPPVIQKKVSDPIFEG